MLLFHRDVIYTSVQVTVKTNQELLCCNKQICDGVYIGNSLHKPIDNKIVIDVMNTCNESIVLDKIEPELEIYDNNCLQLCNEVNQINIVCSVTAEKRAKLKEKLQLPDDLNHEEKKNLLEICDEFADVLVFHIKGEPLPITTAIEHEINTDSRAGPIYIKPYRLPESQKNIIRDQINE